MGHDIDVICITFICDVLILVPVSQSDVSYHRFVTTVFGIYWCREGRADVPVIIGKSVHTSHMAFRNVNFNKPWVIVKPTLFSSYCSNERQAKESQQIVLRKQSDFV